MDIRGPRQGALVRCNEFYYINAQVKVMEGDPNASDVFLFYPINA